MASLDKSYQLFKIIQKKLADLGDAERTVSSPAEESPHPVDIIYFQHTFPWKSKSFLKEKYVKSSPPWRTANYTVGTKDVG